MASHMRFSLSVIFAAFLLITGISCSRTGDTSSHILFKTQAPDTIPYRIPAIASLSDGSLLALADYRHCRSDIGWGRVDIHGRKSYDDGETWTEEFPLLEGTGVSKAVDCGFGDPALAADRESEEVLLITVCGETVYWHETTNRQNPNRIALLRSLDNARSWEPWKEITEDIYSLFDGSSHGCVQSCFVGSGKICQSRKYKYGSHYRIYAALCARPNGNRVLYSDDFGRTWAALGGIDALPAINGDEPKCEELPDGRVVLSSRTRGGRIFNIFTYSDVSKAEGQWEEPAFSGADNNGCTAMDNACNGEILIVPAVRKSDGVKVSIALQSVPLGPGRTRVGVYFKEVTGGMTAQTMASHWEKPYKVSDQPSAYSTMVLQSNGNIAFYYEEENTPVEGGFDMVYKEIPLDSLTFDRYKIWKKR